MQDVSKSPATMAKIAIDEARVLVERVMEATGYGAPEAAAIADHLLDCELRGVAMGGLSRAISVADHFAQHRGRIDTLRIQRETPVSAALEGGNRVGYLLGAKATEIAIEKARASGIGMVTGHCAIFSGMLSYYVERITAAGFVAVATSSVGPMVAPEGGTEALFGTNPIAFGFPSASEPVIWDIGTSRIMLAETILAARLGQALPEDVAFDKSGQPTRDPHAALAGAFRVWGGHKGSGLALVVQLFGLMAGTPVVQETYGSIGLFLQAIDPALFGDPEDFATKVAEFSDLLRANRPVEGGPALRLPFERSRQRRKEQLARGYIEVAEEVLRQLHARVDKG
ncbi:Ldh family oxidoreductase [Paracoccus pantotrophus]|uniref:Ldh family oxidoreductase n=1 Tax=Paracoccus pantotrophus TaxID=82367 RepID=UPI000E08D8B1|nr:Ldh family oxidoreductase [Paracoccus pantotrophus]RDD96932.1 Ldh family oxidoreductase [Paracoccus pantotrophus]WGR66595.1 Ldh family oxidoreductase [Paracoccus pantotrophus]